MCRAFFSWLSLFILFFSHLAIGQNSEAKRYILARTDTQRLQELARFFAFRDSALRAEAWQMAAEKGWPTREIRPDGTLIELSRLTPYGRPLYFTTYNDDAAVSTQTDLVHSGGGAGLNLEGQNMIVGEWDGGAVRASHELLSPRVVQVDGAAVLDNHATHVAGTLIGDGTPNAAAKGMAPQATLWAHDWTNDNTEMATAAAQGLLVSNHSYGSVTGWNGSDWWGWTAYSHREDEGFGLYAGDADDWDRIAVNAPFYLIVKSAGNDRNDFSTDPFNYQFPSSTSPANPVAFDSNDSLRSPENDGGSDGYESITWSGNAKNILTVGAVNDVLNYSGPASVSMSSFSGWGPTDDGRIKPDLVGNGVGLRSSLAGNNSQYGSYSGTSMSAPNVAGSLILLQQHYQETHNNRSMRSSTLKALAIHTARECGNHPGPDYRFGWGLLSTRDAAAVITADVENNGTIREDTLTNGGSLQWSFTAKGSEPLRITLCYIDPAAPGNWALNDRNPNLIHDLDISLSDGLSSFLPYVLDRTNPSAAATTANNDLDNVEQIFLANPTAGQQYTLTLNHEGNLNSDQVFSLIVTGQIGSYYTVAACSTGCDPNQLNNWNSARDGSGSAPPDFSSPDRFVVQNGHHLQGNSDWTLPNELGTLSIEAGAQVTINSGYSYDLAGRIDNEGDLYIQDQAALVQRESSPENQGNGTYHLTRNTGNIIDRQRFNFWSAPVAEATLAGVFSNANPLDFLYFNEQSQAFATVANPANPMETARGYASTPNQNYTGLNFNEDRTFEGTVHNGNLSIALNWAANEYALIGNPYPSAISSAAFLNDNPNLSGALYFFNHTNAPQPSAADYAIWNLLGGTSGNGEEAPDDYIGSAQGFFVQADNPAPTGVNFNNGQRVTGNNQQFFKGAQHRQRLWLSLTHPQGAFQQILIGFVPAASLGYDRLYDAHKNKGNPDLSFYSRAAGLDLGIQGRPPFSKDSVALGLETTLNGSLRISLDSLSAWPPHDEVLLEDAALNRFVDLRQGDYTFAVAPGQDLQNRFYLWLGEVGIGLTEALEPQAIGFYQQSQHLRWTNTDVELVKVEILDWQGRILHSFETGEANRQILLNTLPEGMYLLKAKNRQGDWYSQKLYWR